MCLAGSVVNGPLSSETGGKASSNAADNKYWGMASYGFMAATPEPLKATQICDPSLCTYSLHIMEGSFAAPKGNLSFQPWKMRNPLGTLTQGRIEWQLLVLGDFAFPPWKIKMFRLENSR